MIRSLLQKSVWPFLAFALTTSSAALAQARSDWLDIEVGKSVVIETPKNATAIAITDPNVADIVALASANRMQVQGKSVGSTDLVIQQGAGVAPLIYEVTVHQDLSDLIRRVDALVEGEPPNIYPLRDRIVVQGAVEDLDTLEHVSQVAAIYDANFVNLMTVKGDHQVQLEVVFAEVSRTALRELGINAILRTNIGGSHVAASLRAPLSSTVSNVDTSGKQIKGINGGSITGAAAGAFDVATVVTAGVTQIAGVLSVLDDYRVGKILAQPTIVCLSGQQGEFLAGGELPVPAPGSIGTISVSYREYGVKLVFNPTVLAGNVIDMRAYVEVSAPDYGNGTTLTGIVIPGFISRKAKTHVRIDSGKTFAMAGMLEDTTSFDRAQIPILGSIPVIGSLFRYVQQQRVETELVIFVTPRLVRPLGPGEVPAPPGTTEDSNPNDAEFFLLGMDHKAGTRTAQPTGKVGLQR